MALATAFLFGVLVGLALRPLVNAYVLSRVAHRFELDVSRVNEERYFLQDRTVR